MVKRILIVFIALSLGSIVTAEEKSIYKKYDKQGVPEFSDVPDKGAKPVPLPPMNTYKQKPLPKRSEKKTKPDGPKSYKALNITQPVNDKVVRENAGNVTVSITTEPKLQPGHSIKVVLNGDEKAALKGTKSNYTFKNISRGTHTVQAFIVDKNNKTLSSSTIITFHLQRIVYKPKPKPKNPANNNNSSGSP